MSDLTEAWRAAGIAEGDTVLLHSNAKRMMRRLLKEERNADPMLVIDSLAEVVTGSGCILLPTFNFDFASGHPFDVRATPSQMGLLTEYRRDRYPRTGHPIYSFSAIGRQEDGFSGVVNFSGYGADSPFGLLHRWGGKIAILDLPDQDAMTFYHYVEEAHEVPYRFHKRFTGPYTGWDGATSERSFGLFVRDIDAGVVTDVCGMESLLWERGLYRGERPGQGWGIRTIEAAALFDATSEAIKAGRAEGLLYRREVEHS